MPHTIRDGAVDPAMQKCIDECVRCHNICTTTATYCLQRGGQHAEAEHIVTLLDCAEICRTSADFMLRGSHLHTSSCAVCAEVCRACADTCEKMGDDAVMQRCADECRRCAESCDKMALAIPR
jgi:hypothetical protein